MKTPERLLAHIKKHHYGILIIVLATILGSIGITGAYTVFRVSKVKNIANTTKTEISQPINTEVNDTLRPISTKAPKNFKEIAHEKVNSEELSGQEAGQEIGTVDTPQIKEKAIQAVEDPQITIEKCKIIAKDQAKQNAFDARAKYLTQALNEELKTKSCSPHYPSEIQKMMDSTQQEYDTYKRQYDNAVARGDLAAAEVYSMSMLITAPTLAEMRKNSQQYTTNCFNNFTQTGNVLYDNSYQASYDRQYLACISKK